MADQLSRLHTYPAVDPRRVSQVIHGSDTGIPGSILPVKYRYALARVQSGPEGPAGSLIAMLPMTGVSYSVGMYSGTDMSGTVYLPTMFLDQMPHTPLNTYERWNHPDRSLPLATLFEVGNVAIYVMRNEKVVWGGILWGRSYSSGDGTLQITAMSWEGYIYYRAFRKSIAFPKSTDKYTIWRSVLMQCLTDFSWKGDDGKGKNAGGIADVGTTSWTGKTQKDPFTNQTVQNYPLEAYKEHWPNNNPQIELPDPNMKFADPQTQNNPTFSTTVDRDEWRGFSLSSVGEQLQTWADANTLTTSGGFEYRVLCWFDTTNQRFRQRYTFGEMDYGEFNDVSASPVKILSPLFGSMIWDNDLGDYRQSTKYKTDVVFDYPGHISSWTLAESMEEVATRVIVTGGGEEANAKIASYRSHIDLMRPWFTGDGSDGWLLYDKVYGFGSTDPSVINSRAEVLLNKVRPSVAARLDDVAGANGSSQRTSQKATDLSITLYQDPTTTFPDWSLGDWVTFAIQDPFYGGIMYLQRRIIGYSVNVVMDNETDYSHEEISLELTDQTRISESTS